MMYVDRMVLNLTESLCRRFQRLTGRTNVWLAMQLTNLSIIVYFVWAGLYFWRSNVGWRVVLGVFCGALLYVLTQTILRVPIEAHENEAYRRVANGLRNPRRMRDALLRIPFLTLSIVLLYPIVLISATLRLPLVILSYSLVVMTTIVLYLLACDPLPPCAGTVREWLGGSVRTPAAAAESAGGDAGGPGAAMRHARAIASSTISSMRRV